MKNLSTKNILLILKLLFPIIMFLLAFIFYSKLPDQIPIHWNYNGEIDNYGTKNSIFIFPSIVLGIVFLFYLLRYIDPKSSKYNKFEKSWEKIQFIILGYLFYIYCITILLTFNPELSVIKFIMFGMGILFVLLGNYMGKIRSNYFVGIKTPWTIENEEVWNKTHRLGGYLFVIAGILTFISGFFNIFNGVIFFLIILIVSLFPILYSYLIYRKIVK